MYIYIYIYIMCTYINTYTHAGLSGSPRRGPP